MAAGGAAASLSLAQPMPSALRMRRNLLKLSQNLFRRTARRNEAHIARSTVGGAKQCSKVVQSLLAYLDQNGSLNVMP